MIIQGFEINVDSEKVKTAFGYTDRVHRDIDGQVVEIDNPDTIEEYLRKYLLGVIENKVSLNGHCC